MVMTFLPMLIASHSPDVALDHQFVAGEKLAYQVMSHITSEERGRGLDTWLPSDLDINYNFSYTVSKIQSDGIAVIHYLRPSMTEITGETLDAGPKTVVRNVNLNALLTVSPINEVLEQKDLSKKAVTGYATLKNRSAQGAMSFFLPFISDIHRMALFIGNVEDSLDFAPKFPLRPVKPGDTWKKTVGFEPQKLKGSGKQAVQRLDYTYTYLGPMLSNGKHVLRVQGKLKFATDSAEYFKQVLADHASETNVAKVPLHLNSTIDFDLDPQTRDLLHAEGVADGGFQIFLTEAGDVAAQEERFKGRTTIDLSGKRLAPNK